MKALADGGRQLGPHLGGRQGRVRSSTRRQKNGLTVTVGIWLGHDRHGFNYNNADQVAKQLEEARKIVLKYKDHPAVLMWGLGNEMEGYDKGDNAAIWSAVESLAAEVKRLDPNHPTMTVVAEIGGDRVKNIHRLCPTSTSSASTATAARPRSRSATRRPAARSPTSSPSTARPASGRRPRTRGRCRRADQHRQGRVLSQGLRAGDRARGALPRVVRLHLGQQAGGDGDLVRPVPARRLELAGVDALTETVDRQAARQSLPGHRVPDDLGTGRGRARARP